MRKPKKKKVTFECPYKGIAYNLVPGYMSGYGCPVCKAISSSHVGMSKPLTLEQWEAKVRNGYNK